MGVVGTNLTLHRQIFIIHVDWKVASDVFMMFWTALNQTTFSSAAVYK